MPDDPLLPNDLLHPLMPQALHDALAAVRSQGKYYGGAPVVPGPPGVLGPSSMIFEPARFPTISGPGDQPPYMEWGAKQNDPGPLRKPPAPRGERELPAVKTFMDRIWDNYAKRMTPEEFLNSETLWGSARVMAEQSNMSESEAFAHIANQIFSRMGANRFMTPESARRFMGAARGIKPVED